MIFEFVFSSSSNRFCVDNKTASDREINNILYTEHQDCVVCTGPMLWGAGPGVCIHEAPLTPDMAPADAPSCSSCSSFPALHGST